MRLQSGAPVGAIQMSSFCSFAGLGAGPWNCCCRVLTVARPLDPPFTPPYPIDILHPMPFSSPPPPSRLPSPLTPRHLSLSPTGRATCGGWSYLGLAQEGERGTRRGAWSAGWSRLQGPLPGGSLARHLLGGGCEGCFVTSVNLLDATFPSRHHEEVHCGEPGNPPAASREATSCFPQCFHG